MKIHCQELSIVLDIIFALLKYKFKSILKNMHFQLSVTRHSTNQAFNQSGIQPIRHSINQAFNKSGVTDENSKIILLMILLITDFLIA